MKPKQKSKQPSALEKYITPPCLTDRKTYNLADMDTTQISQCRDEVKAALEANRKHYEKLASAFDRLRREADLIYPESHEVSKLLRSKKNVPQPPPDLTKMFDKLHELWAKERQARAGRLNHNAFEEAKGEWRKQRKHQQQPPKSPPPILALPALTPSTARAQRLQDARVRASATEYQGLGVNLGSDDPATWIRIPPTPGQLLVDLNTAGQLQMFASTDLSGVRG